MRILMGAEAMQVLKFLINHPCVDINRALGESFSLFTFASHHSLSHDKLGCTPLTFACLNCATDLVESILTITDISVNVALTETAPLASAWFHSIQNGLTPLMIAVLLECPEIVRLLLKHPQIDINLPMTATMRRRPSQEIELTPMDVATYINNQVAMQLLEEYSTRTGIKLTTTGRKATTWWVQVCALDWRVLNCLC